MNRVSLEMIERAFSEVGKTDEALKTRQGIIRDVPLLVAMRAIDMAIDAIALSSHKRTGAVAVEIDLGAWCDQCDRRVATKEVDKCRSKWCGARP